MSGILERARARIPSISAFARRAAKDPRRMSYDLLPILSTPAQRDLVAGIVARLRPSTAHFTPSEDACDWHRRVREDGITQTLPALPAAHIAAMRAYFETALCYDPFRPHLGQFRYDRVSSDECNMAFFSTAQTISAPHVLALLNHPTVLETAELYLGCKPMLDNVGAWWSFGGRAAAKGTQRYHRDLDSLRGFKMFVYLTDVDLAAGPHMFMKTSHRSPVLDTGSAQSDAAVHAAFGVENEIAVTGPAGTWFLADTFGFHKGALPLTGRRLILTAQYNLNATPHMPRPPVLSGLAPEYDPYVNRLLFRTGR